MCKCFAGWLLICLCPKPDQYSLSYLLNFFLFPMVETTGGTGCQWHKVVLESCWRHHGIWGSLGVRPTCMHACTCVSKGKSTGELCTGGQTCCGGLTLAGCQVPTKAILSLPAPPSAGQGRQNITKGSWVKIRTRRDHSTNYCHRQNRLNLGKINSIYPH